MLQNKKVKLGNFVWYIFSIIRIIRFRDSQKEIIAKHKLLLRVIIPLHKWNNILRFPKLIRAVHLRMNTHSGHLPLYPIVSYKHNIHSFAYVCF